VFVIIALPDRRAGGVAEKINLPGNSRFKGAHNRGYRTGNRFTELFNRGNIARRGTARRAPTIDNDNNPVKMVGHDHKYTQFDVRTKDGCLVPFVANNFSQIIQYQYPVHNFAKQVFALMRAQGDEIRPGSGGVKAGQADGSAAAGGNTA